MEEELRDFELDLSEAELLRKINSFEERGFMYLQQWQMDEPRVPDRYKLPSGNILDEGELLTFFNKVKPEFGNPKYLEVRDALYYCKLINSCLYDGQRLGYESFIDEKDLQRARRKYSKGKEVIYNKELAKKFLLEPKSL